MKRIEKLDFLLKIISEKEKYISSMDLYKETNNVIDQKELTPMTDKLVDDGFISKKIDKDSTNRLTPPYYCRITYEGLVFIDNGGFINRYKKDNLNQYWKITKTVVNVLNAVIILLVAALGVYFSWESNRKTELLNEKDLQIKKLNNKIEQISKQVDSIDY